MSEQGAIVIEGHIQGLSNTRSLGEKGIPVYVIDKNNCVARYSRYCRKFFRCPDYNSHEFIEFLISLAQRENIRDWILIPSNDHAVYSLAMYKSELDKYYKIPGNGHMVIDSIYDKSKLLSIAERCSLPIPATYYISDPQGGLPGNANYPVIIKGRNGLTFYKTFGKKALLANDEPELKKHLTLVKEKADISKVFVQELIPFDGSNKTISFTAFCENGEIRSYWMGEKIREHPFRFGTATFARSMYEQKCYEQSIPLLKNLKYNGICEVEYLKDPRDGMFKLIEINARTWLWTGLAKASGVDYAGILFYSLTDREVSHPLTYLTDIKWINWFTDLPYSFTSIVKNQMTLAEYLKSLKGPRVDALWSTDDKLPYFSYVFMLPLFKKTR